MSKDTPIDAVDGLFAETPDGPRLLGSRCAECDTPYFPRSERCHNPSCARTRMQDAAFGPGGSLWSVAVQNYPPPPPAIVDDPYSPYAVGVVDLDEGLRVLGRLTVPADRVAVGDRMELVIAPLATSGVGAQTRSWQFKPAAA